MPKSSSKGLTPERIRQLALNGAQNLWKELQAEIVALEKTFPELSAASGRRAVKTVQTRTRQMSAAARKAVSARMKKYWAERRKAKAGKQKTATRQS